MPELEDLVNYAIVVVIAATLVLLITGKFFDLTVERQSSVQTRATINLLQDIVTEGPDLMVDPFGNRMKLMFNKTAYDEISRIDENSGNDLIGCCDSVQYDYKFAIGSYTGAASTEPSEKLAVNPLSGIKSNYLSVGEYLDIGDSCYSSFGLGTKIVSSVPISVCDGTLANCDPAVAYIETTHTPLAEMAYWISQARQSDSDFTKRIPFSEKDYNKDNILTIDDANKQICLKGNCRRFYCGNIIGSKGDDELHGQIPWSFPPKTCSFAQIVRENGGITIVGRYQ